MSNELPQAEALTTRDFDEIEYAFVRLARGEPAEYEAGRIVGRYQSDLTLAYRGHETEVTQVDEWEVVEYKPVTSSLERAQVKAGLEADA